MDKDGKEEESGSDEEGVKESLDHKCHLVWEGVTNQAQFGDKLKVVYDVRTEVDGRKPFLDKKCEYLWDSVMNFQSGRAIGLGEEDTFKEKMLESLN